MMHGPRVRQAQTLTLVLGVMLATLIFVPSRGTSDMHFWLDWSHNVDTTGLGTGFTQDRADYPPLSSVILLGAAQVAHLLHIELWVAIKLFITAFLLLTSFVLWLWTRDVPATLILYAALFINSVALAYIDIFYAPTLILALWALQRGKVTLFSALFSITILIKWQPLIIAPFLILYLVGIDNLSQWRQIAARKLAAAILAPAAVIGLVTVAVFGVKPVLGALRLALTNKALSGDALNLCWIFTHFLHVWFPGHYGGLKDGVAVEILGPPWPLSLLAHLLFVAVYLTTLIQFFRRVKSFENLILYSLLGYFAYFTLATGVQENHLVPAMILAVILFWLNRTYAPMMILVVAMCNLNMFVFYGVDGQGLPFDRVVGHTVDIALVIAIFNVIAFAVFWVTYVFQHAAHTPAEKAEEPAQDGPSLV